MAGSGELQASKVKTVWPCPLCDETFHWRRHLDKHVEGHRNNACRLCDAAITTRKELSAHMLQQHQVVVRDDKHGCEHCKRRFPRRRALFSHYQSSHADGKIVCLDCGAFLDSEPDLERHAATHIKDRPWKCQRCHASFSRRQQYTLHVEAHDRYCCKVCSRNFATKLALTEHERDSHGVATSRHKCLRCNAHFERPCQLRRHQESYTGDGGVLECRPQGGQCCGRKYATSRSLKLHQSSVRHLELATPDHRKKFECAKCGRCFARKSSLSRHLRGARRYACADCGLVAASAHGLRRHRALHSGGPRRFVCDRCGAAFTALAALHEHAAYRHSDERRYQCRVCGLTFKTNSALTRHLQAHSDSRPHACPCGQRYKRASHLRRHEAAAHGPAQRPSRTVQRIPPATKVAETSSALVATIVVAETNQVVAIRHLPAPASASAPVPAGEEISQRWPTGGTGETAGQRSLQPEDSLRVHQEVVIFNKPLRAMSGSDVGISCHTLLESMGSVASAQGSTGTSYKDMVEQALGTSQQTMGAYHELDPTMDVANLRKGSHQEMMGGLVELGSGDLLQQAMEMAHRDLRHGLGTPEQMLRDGYDFGATGLEFTTLQTVHKARDLSQLTEDDMAFSADTFLL